MCILDTRDFHAGNSLANTAAGQGVDPIPHLQPRAARRPGGQGAVPVVQGMGGPTVFSSHASKMPVHPEMLLKIKDHVKFAEPDGECQRRRPVHPQANRAGRRQSPAEAREVRRKRPLTEYPGNILKRKGLQFDGTAFGKWLGAPLACGYLGRRALPPAEGVDGTFRRVLLHVSRENRKTGTAWFS
jgi:hypothetical protein